MPNTQIAPTDDTVPTGRRRSLMALVVSLVLLSGLALLATWESRTSTFQSRYFSRYGQRLGYELQPGPSPDIRFPVTGPYDARLGYTTIPAMVDRVVSGGAFEITEQARVSPEFEKLMDRGLFPIYREKARGGLGILDRTGDTVFAAPHPARIYTSFDSIPELVWRSLVFIENREFLREGHPLKNPAVEWDRFARSFGELVLSKLGRDGNVPGGSTLATQLEKFRHSDEGRTSGGGDKLRQMASASYRAYLDGPETTEAQKRILTDYVNSVPLAAQRNHGEVTGTADGLWAWYGIPFDEANRLLRGKDLTAEEDARRPEVFRKALSLLVAHRRPTYYLARPSGRADLEALTDEHLGLLVDAGLLDPGLAEGAAAARLNVLSAAPDRPRPSFVERKAANQVRTHVLELAGVPQLYDLDRYDLTIRSTLDMEWQSGVADVLARLKDRQFIAQNGFGDARLLGTGVPDSVIYTFTLLEHTDLGNVIRVQTDNYDGPLNLSGSGRLELGSTAKLRTLVTYLEIVEELHARLSAMPRDSLRRMSVAGPDRLTRWAVDYLSARPDADLPGMLEAAMDRAYSASPAESFATGGGVQTFSNFDNTYDGAVLTVGQAFRNSVNLPSVRTMRDIVQYLIYRSPSSPARMLQDPDDPNRRSYLEAFARDEGARFVRQFVRKYQGQLAPEMFGTLLRERRLTPMRMAWAYRTVAPDAPVERFREFLTSYAPFAGLSEGAVADVYRRADPAPHPLADLGYLAGIHPLELWVFKYLLAHPEATQAQVVEASPDVRVEVYGWLLESRSRDAQNTRIRTMLEIEAFQDVHRRWSRLGYPFGNIVPSYGTAIGSSGDRPLALAELMGIIRNDGVRYPVVRVEELHFAEDTPFETRVRRIPAEGERVMSREVAATLRTALIDVVENGTARRARGAVVDSAGQPLVMGAKTGTGDNRFRIYGAGGSLVGTRVVNRTATLAFFLGDRWYGVITAYVPGQNAGNYRFTSGLPSQIMKVAGPRLMGLGTR